VDVEHQPTDLAVGGSNPSRRAPSPQLSGLLDRLRPHATTWPIRASLTLVSVKGCATRRGCLPAGSRGTVARYAEALSTLWRLPGAIEARVPVRARRSGAARGGQRVLPRSRWSCFLVKPDTLLRPGAGDEAPVVVVAPVGSQLPLVAERYPTVQPTAASSSGLELGAAGRTLGDADKAKAVNDLRASLLQGIGGAVVLLGAYSTYRQLQPGGDQLQVAQQGQVAERFIGGRRVSAWVAGGRR
jgi:hypothetical protein